MDILLEAKGIRKTYGELEVLKGVDMHVTRGEVLSIIGASGAGKSTLLHIISTLDSADAGQVFFNGAEILRFSQAKQSALRNSAIGFVFQFHNLLPEFTALENVCMPAFIKGVGIADAEDKAMNLLQLLGINARAHHKPSELSGGEQQRVAVARALINDPAIVFADEPSGNLDSKNADELHQLFFDLREQLGQTFVIVTHNKELAKMADRILEMRDGRIIA